MKFLRFSVIAAISTSTIAIAHSGRTNSSGGHNDYKHGGYHSHTGYSSHSSSYTSSRGDGHYMLLMPVLFVLALFIIYLKNKIETGIDDGMSIGKIILEIIKDGGCLVYKILEAMLSSLGVVISIGVMIWAGMVILLGVLILIAFLLC